MSTTVVLQRASDDVFNAATMSGTAPSASYSLSTLTRRDPATRVRFGSGTVTVTFTLAAPARGDIFVLPCSNLDSGSTVAALTNGAGLNEAITIPALQQQGIPRTAILDLTVAEPNATTRTSNVWNLVITGNSVNVTLGGAVFLFTPKRTVDAVQWGLSYEKGHQADEHRNVYASRDRFDFRTTERVLSWQASVEPSELTDLEDCYDANHGIVYPGLLWVQRDELDAYIGTFGPKFRARQRDGYFLYDVACDFLELSKGKPV